MQSRVWAFNPADDVRIHWRAPTIMIACLVLGIAFIFFHHFLYQFFDGQVAGDDSEQQWVTRAGTAIAFVIKLALTTSTATAYIQWFWYQLGRQPVKLKHVDTMFGAITNAWVFLNIRLWSRYILLAVPAIVTWIIPFSAIVTPGTIIVKPSLYQTSQAYVVTQNELSWLGYASQRNRSYLPGDVIETAQLESIELLTMNIGEIVTIPKSDTKSNISYALSFEGPAVSCKRADNITTKSVNQSMTEFESDIPFTYLMQAFVPQPGFGPDMNASFFNQSGVVADVDVLYLDTFSNDSSKVIVYMNMGENVGEVLSCAFYNATYNTQFQLFSDGSQSIVTSTEFLNDIAAKDHVSSLSDPSPAGITMSSYLALIYSFGEKLNGAYTKAKTSEAADAAIGSNGIPMLVYSPKMTFSAKSAKTPAALDDFATALESIMMNYTLSSRFAFQASDASSLLQDLGVYTNISTDADVSFFRNQFSYNPKDLVIAYGLSVFWAIICIAMGFFAIMKNGGSYSFNFSTVARVTQDPEAGRGLSGEKAVVGADPLPKEIGSAIVRQGTFNSASEGGKLKRKGTGLTFDSVSEDGRLKRKDTGPGSC